MPPMIQAELPHMAPSPGRAGCVPILKWCGGKRWLVPTIAPAIHRQLIKTGGRYVEPFLGGAAIALDLGLPYMILSDICQPLISMYRTICKTPAAVAWMVQHLIAQGTDEAAYYALRATPSTSPVVNAARFLYLNKLGYNGLYRENRTGGFNVPYGKNPTRRLPTIEDLLPVAQALAHATITATGFAATIAQARRGDVVYADPPYYATFSDYAADGFDDDAHVALAAALHAAAGRGATIIASNSDHPRIRELYAWACITPLHEHHAIGPTKAQRGKKAAVLICSDEIYL